jgi:mannose-6-phosphate isomerase-like protein (cupin superfamily)
MSYTIKNLRQTEDLAPKFGFSELGEAHFPREDLQAQTIGLAFHVVKPGKRQSFAHRHEEAEEVYVVLSGSGRVKLDAAVEDLQVMDAIRVSPKVARSFEAGPEGMEMLVFGPRHAGDGEIIQEDFWSQGAP